MLFLLNNREESPGKIILNVQPLPWVDHAAYLGLKELDCNMRRAAYNVESVEQLTVFDFAHLLEEFAELQTYSYSFYGSNLYDLLQSSYIRPGNYLLEMLGMFPGRLNTPQSRSHE